VQRLIDYMEESLVELEDAAGLRRRRTKAKGGSVRTAATGKKTRAKSKAASGTGTRPVPRLKTKAGGKAATRPKRSGAGQ